jgi:hypothetical protein
MTEPLPDRADHVIASIDAALDDYLSLDAMRWAPDAEPDNGPIPVYSFDRDAVIWLTPADADAHYIAQGARQFHVRQCYWIPSEGDPIALTGIAEHS